MTYIPAPDRYQSMTYRRCGKSGIKLPVISLGLWHNFGDTAPYENMRALCRTAFDHGITHFDLANNYGPEPGAAERNFGKILRDDLGVYRDELIISTKAGYLMWDGPYGDWGSRKYLLASLDRSLQRMGLEVGPAASARLDRELAAMASVLEAPHCSLWVSAVQERESYFFHRLTELQPQAARGATDEALVLRAPQAYLERWLPAAGGLLQEPMFAGAAARAEQARTYSPGSLRPEISSWQKTIRPAPERISSSGV